jgi:hypothetical protein
MRQDLHTLIERMTTVEKPPVNSDQSVPWHAYREAEELSDPKIIDELEQYVESETSKASRKCAYFILGKLGKKLGRPECASILLSSAARETDKYVLLDLLTALSEVEIPSRADLSAVFVLLGDKRSLVRHSAIQALKMAKSSKAEDHVLTLLQSTSDAYDIVYCHSTLGRIGTEKAIPYIEGNLDSRKRDVRISANVAIENIRKRLGRAVMSDTGELAQ